MLAVISMVHNCGIFRRIQSVVTWIKLSIEYAGYEGVLVDVIVLSICV
jgi:hypothetical protein